MAPNAAIVPSASTWTIQCKMGIGHFPVYRGAYKPKQVDLSTNL
jgi:hypothetical protein